MSDVPDDEINHRCRSADKQLRILRETLEDADHEFAAEVADLETRLQGVWERLVDEPEPEANHEVGPLPDGGRHAEELGYPMAVRDDLNALAVDRFMEQVSEYGEGKTWFQDTPEWHLWNAVRNIVGAVPRNPHEEVDAEGIADAINYLNFAVEIDLHVSGKLNKEALPDGGRVVSLAGPEEVSHSRCDGFGHEWGEEP